MIGQMRVAGPDRFEEVYAYLKGIRQPLFGEAFQWDDMVICHDRNGIELIIRIEIRKKERLSPG